MEEEISIEILELDKWEGTGSLSRPDGASSLPKILRPPDARAPLISLASG